MQSYLAIWGKRLFMFMAFVSVIFMIVAVTHNHLERLRSQTSGMPSDYVSAADVTKQLDCLARNIYWEAASEPFEGKVAVAQVTMNRVADGRFADSVCGVVYQKNVFYQRVVCQFSWYCESNHKIRPINRELYRESEDVAKRVLLENFRLPGLKNAIYYHADYVNPGWNKPRIQKIGRHIFYGERT